MKKKLTLTIDEDVYAQLGELHRKVSVSEIVTWVLKAVITDIQGMPDEDFKKLMDSDPRGKEVHAYLRDKLGPLVDKVESGIENVNKPLKRKTHWSKNV
jgi:predicted CopG family antitoxin